MTQQITASLQSVIRGFGDKHALGTCRSTKGAHVEICWHNPSDLSFIMVFLLFKMYSV